MDSTNITDESMKVVGKLKHLRILGLNGTKITDKGLKELVGLKELEDLVLSSTQVTAAGVTDLKKALPKCRINSD